MKVLKVFSISVAVFAVLFLGVALYITSAMPQLLQTNNSSSTTDSSPDTKNDENAEVKRDALQPSSTEKTPSTTKSHSSETTDPPNAEDNSSEAADSSVTQPEDSLQPEPVQSLMSSSENVVQESPKVSSSLDSSTLIIGRWKAAGIPNGYMEFFRDGTFARGTYEGENDYYEFSGTYSFSNNTRLKLQYELWTLATPPDYKTTSVENTSHVFEIAVNDNKLVIPGAKKPFGETEWTRVDYNQ
ncbi:hypothetical protein [Paenibacillus massiliensis]|uniref:hypothetical protein n=1 Tax=Paenibacillus massiliensis TaxID=225917 RepID=UPI00040047EB|nr:hypothetical protein [Paenibacillus massiliensis]